MSSSSYRKSGMTRGESLTASLLQSSATSPVSSDGTSRPRTGVRSFAGSMASATTTKNQLGTFMGVFLPCCLSIFGVILFLRLSWIVGQAGLVQTFGMIILAYAVDVFTVLSISAIATNGEMKGGGAYYLISRSLGPEFGGAIGLILYLANTTAVSMYLLGGAEFLIDTFGMTIVNNLHWNKFFISIIALLVLTVIAIVGASAFAKSALVLWCLLILSILVAFISLLFVPNRDEQKGYLGLSADVMNNNIKANYTGDYDFQTTFAIFFPAVTGITAGANMSGDLKDPGSSIPLGTLCALGVSCLVYFGISILLAASSDRKYLVQDSFYLQNITFQKWVYIPGEFSSLFASALASIVGAARVFQALCKDELIPFISFFAKGSAKGNEPRRAVWLTVALAAAFCLMGNLNAIAPFNTMCFLLTYAVLNFACFVHAVTGTPGFRPLFKYFHWGSAGVGFMTAVGVMFMVSPLYAGICLLVLIALMFLIHYRAPDRGWGAVSQALIFHQVRKYLLRLDLSREHVKYWRPSMLLLVSDPTSSLNLIHFVNNLKKGGLYVIGNVLQGTWDEKIGLLRDQDKAMESLIKVHGIKAFSASLVSPTIREGVQNMLLTSGLGSMRPNTVIMGFLEDRASTSSLSPDSQKAPRATFFGSAKKSSSTRQAAHQEAQRRLMMVRGAVGNSERMSCQEYVSILRDAFNMEKNLIIARNFDTLNADRFVSSMKPVKCGKGKTTMTIDIWPLTSVGDASHPMNRCFSPASRGGEGSVASPSRSDSDSDMEAEDAIMDGLESGEGPEVRMLDVISLGQQETRTYGDASLCLMMGFMLHHTKFWSRYTSLRVCSYVNSRDQYADEVNRLTKLLQRVRIKASIHVCVVNEEVSWIRQEFPDCENIDSLPMQERNRALNSLICNHSHRTGVTFITVDGPPVANDVEDCEAYLRSLDLLSKGTPPIMMVHSMANVISIEL